MMQEVRIEDCTSEQQRGAGALGGHDAADAASARAGRHVQHHPAPLPGTPAQTPTSSEVRLCRRLLISCLMSCQRDSHSLCDGAPCSNTGHESATLALQVLYPCMAATNV